MLSPGPVRCVDLLMGGGEAAAFAFSLSAPDHDHCEDERYGDRAVGQNLQVTPFLRATQSEW